MRSYQCFVILASASLLTACHDKADAPATAVIAKCFHSSAFFPEKVTGQDDFSAIADVAFSKSGKIFKKEVDIRSPHCGLLTISAVLPKDFDMLLEETKIGDEEKFCRGNHCVFDYKKYTVGIRGTGDIEQIDDKLKIIFTKLDYFKVNDSLSSEDDIDALRRIVSRDIKMINPNH